MKKTCYLMLLFYFMVQLSSAQSVQGIEARKLLPHVLQVEVDTKTKCIKQIEFDADNPLKEEDWEAWLANFNHLFFPDTHFSFWKKETDKWGFTHLIYQQYYQNYRVEYAVLKAHIKNGFVYQLNAEVYETKKPSDFSNLDKVNAQKAKEIAQDYFFSQKIDTTGIKVELVEQLFFPSPKGFFVPAYKVDIYADLGQLKRAYLYISSEDGEILFEENRIMTSNVPGTAVTKYCGTRQIVTDSVYYNTFYLKETGARNIHTLNWLGTTISGAEFVNSNHYWNTTANQDNAAYDAHFMAEKTFDYYYLVHGRNSYDNAGATINSFVHYGNNTSNSAWTGNSFIYGDGNGVDYQAFTAPDIVAHEMTHAITENTANLVYQNESGALSESFSDILGVTIDYYANPANANFTIGEQISLGGTPFRSMENPHQYNHPDTYEQDYWYIGSSDNGGVHTNSGVQNYWYYLLCNGGSGINDLNVPYNVNAIGMTKAADIAYRTLTVYLTSNSDYEDAFYYSIQAAKDLYGSCSNEKDQVINAWKAVGIDGPITSQTIAHFQGDSTHFCSAPATVAFSNLSTNGVSYSWDFGDNTSSTLANPTHTYTSSGIYTVSLIVMGCNGADTLTIPNYINAITYPAPINATCTPVTQFPSNGYGILRVTLNDLDNPSTAGIYSDFTCLKGASLTEETQYLLRIKTVGTNTYLKTWIDYNNDGAFDNSEEIASFFTGSTTYMAVFKVPTTGVALNTPLRLRVLSTPNAINSACQNPYYAQAEDYRVVIDSSALPPVANFHISDSTDIVVAGTNITFSDLSLNAPTTWSWTINGGNPTISTSQNITANFPTVGTYHIQLIVGNNYGSDTIAKTIHVVAPISLCGLIISNQVSNNFSGIFYDSGGAIGAYQSNESCNLLISPSICADSIILEFTQFSTRNGYDYLSVYDGTTSTAPLLLNWSGASLPPSVVATSGNMFVQWNSLQSSSFYLGFTGKWHTIQKTNNPPIANFSFSPLNPPLQDTVFFQDLSTNNATIWAWDFGDGSTSALQNPQHSYNLPGNYTVTLISTSCGASDTLQQNITVQPSPNVTFSPNAYSFNLSCNDTLSVPLYIQNTGGGTLLWNVQKQINMLVWTYGVDTLPNTGLSYQNTLSIVNQYVPYANYISSPTTDTTLMRTLLQGKTTLLIPSLTSGQASIISQFKNVFREFAAGGGTVIVCGSNILVWNKIGLFTGTTSYQYLQLLDLPVLNNTTPLTHYLGDTIHTSYRMFTANIQNPNKTTILNKSVYNIYYDVLSYIPVSAGRAVYVGFDYYTYNPEVARVLANAVEWSAFDAVTATPSFGATASGGTDTAYLHINATGFNGGLDTLYALIHSNDLSNPLDSIPIYLTISQMPCVNFGSFLLNSCSGTVNFVDSTNNSLNNWFWDFGDGDTSILQNPTHTYLSAGTYQVKLIVNNGTGIDSISKTVVIPMLGQPVAASCTPASANSGNTGILKVELNTLINTSLASVEGYKDFTCGQGTTLITNTQYLLKVKIVDVYSYVKAWIDYNNDGIFTNNELIADFSPGSQNKQTTFTVPANATLNTVLRLRVMSNANQNGIPSACTSPLTGQAEDYRLIITTPQPIPPTANFVFSDTIVGVGRTINLTDLSSNYPSTWAWTINGGTPNSSSSQNLSTSFANAGIYAVQLISSNNYGSDTITKNIRVENITLLCAGTNDQKTTAISGILMDSGGDTNPYENDENCTLLISGGACADSIKLNFTNFSTNASDLLSVYDGTSEAGVLLLNNSGTVLPNVLKATSGNMFIKWRSNSTFTGMGFVANWRTYQHSATPPTTDFSFSPNNAALLSTVSFQNQSSNKATDWEWDFGDGFISHLQHPSHEYAQTGVYAVKLTASSCGASSFITKNVSVQAAPNVSYSPLSFQVNLGCMDTMTLPVYIHNQNGGDLNWNFESVNGNPNPNLLIWSYGVDTVQGGEYKHLKSVLNQYLPNLNYMENVSKNPQTIQALLQGKTTLLIPENENGDMAVSAQILPVIQNFVNSGGTLIVCGDNHPYLWGNMGIFSGTIGGELLTSQNLTFTNTTSPISQNVAPVFQSPDATYYNYISNPNKTTVIAYPYNNILYDILAYLPFGKGKAIYLGFDFNHYNTETSQLLANAIQWTSGINAVPNINISPSLGSLAATNTDTAYIQLNSNSLNGPSNTLYAVLHTNDPNHLSQSIPIYINIPTVPCINFGAKILGECSGQVQFTDSTTNFPTNWLWKFGDGSTSTAQNPYHIYTSAGTYQVTLIVTNAQATDSLHKMLTISSVLGPVSAACAPLSGTNITTGDGITRVGLNTLLNYTIGALEGYKDFSCLYGTALNSGTQYTLDVGTFTTNNDGQAWIDYNSDGVFSTDETIAYFYMGQNSYQMDFTVPILGVAFDVPLRLRVASTTGTLFSPCHNILYGQAEDYSVTITNTHVKIAENILSPDLISVYPNPFQNEFVIECSEQIVANELQLRISNILGQTVYQKQFSKLSQSKWLIPAAFPAGIYFLEVKIGDKKHSQKIVKE